MNARGTKGSPKESSRPKIGIVVGTTRAARFADMPARWLFETCAERTDLDAEIIDLRDYPLPFFDESVAPLLSRPTNEIAKRWGEKVASLDGYVFLTAEYNHSISGVLKNALDHGYSEFNRKPAAFVGYGGLGGARAVEQLRLICVELQMAPTRSAVHITREPILAVLQGKNLTEFDYLAQASAAMFDELAWWTTALSAARAAGSSLVQRTA
ncbi:putative reductase [Labilithrix luteola]|uniref:Putative reductase n=1 Tax=Labilithrix luteola TaxID=1391654 RepID=A0A0K1PQZ7_9BACT|nr:NAD(P)H-dependent oxidoreductase [Labilithrix luteola]AKU95539.1 putative reductase [Labilithrix luteola]